jgi:hypothetical protein
MQLGFGALTLQSKQLQLFYTMGFFISLFWKGSPLPKREYFSLPLEKKLIPKLRAY